MIPNYQQKDYGFPTLLLLTAYIVVLASYSDLLKPKNQSWPMDQMIGS